jgi:DNA adenine methylase
MPFYSPLRYPGGKTRISSLLSDILVKNDLKDAVYVEPYAGGAGAALSLLFQNKVGRIIINDLDEAIYSFWKAALGESDRFINKIKATRVTVAEWHRQKSVYKNPRSKIFDRGFATFFLNRTNRSGIIEGWPIGGLKQQGKWKIDARYNKEALIQKITDISKLQKRIVVSRKDGLKLLKECGKMKNVFVYLDPPYYEKGSCLYLNHYEDRNHNDLAHFLTKQNKLNWVLSYDDTKFIRNLYKQQRNSKFTVNYNLARVRKESEILFFSDALKI